MFDIRHNQQVRLIKIPERYNISDCPIRIGQQGKVMGMAKHGNEPQYLVKWVGKTWPVSVHRNDIERV